MKIQYNDKFVEFTASPGLETLDKLVRTLEFLQTEGRSAVSLVQIYYHLSIYPDKDEFKSILQRLADKGYVIIHKNSPIGLHGNVKPGDFYNVTSAGLEALDRAKTLIQAAFTATDSMF